MMLLNRVRVLSCRLSGGRTLLLRLLSIYLLTLLPLLRFYLFLFRLFRQMLEGSCQNLPNFVSLSRKAFMFGLWFSCWEDKFELVLGEYFVDFCGIKFDSFIVVFDRKTFKDALLHIMLLLLFHFLKNLFSLLNRELLNLKNILYKVVFHLFICLSVIIKTR